MAKKQFTPITSWTPLLLDDGDSIQDLFDTNQNFINYLNQLKKLQSGDATTSPETLGVDTLKDSIKTVVFNGLNSVNNLEMDGTRRFSTDQEIIDWTTNVTLKDRLINDIIQQAKITTTSNFTSNLVTVVVEGLDFMLNSDGSLREEGTYTFTWNGTNWLLNGSIIAVSDYGINITLNGGVLTANDTITVVYVYEGNVNEDYSNLYKITKISQLTNDGPKSGETGYGYKYVNYRDIIILNDLPITIQTNSDADYTNLYAYKAIINIDNNLEVHEKDIIKEYTGRIAFPESYAGFCSQICNAEKDEYGNASVSFYTNNDDSTIIIPSVALIHDPSNHLPDIYEKVSYLRSTGTQYIQIPVDDETGYVAELLINFADWGNTTESTYTAFIGDTTTDADSNDVKSSGLINATTGVWALGVGANDIESTEVASQNVKYSVRVATGSGDGQLWAGGSEVLTDSTTYGDKSANKIKIYLFATNEKGNATGLGKFKYYRARIYNYNCTTLLADVEPCYRKSDFKPGFYDYISETFLVNLGSGDDFIIGGSGNLRDYIISGTTDPSILTKGTPGQFYKNTTTNQYFIYQYTSSGIYTWKPSMLDCIYE